MLILAVEFLVEPLFWVGFSDIFNRKDKLPQDKSKCEKLETEAN